MCGATYAPNVCQACIKADHIGAQTDEDVIQAMLRCGDDDALKLEQDVVKVLDDPNTDPTTRGTLFNINPTIHDIIQNGGVVQQQAMERNFADAKSSISTLIMSKLGECNAALNASGIVVPPAVFSGFFNVEADYKLSDQLMGTVKA
ncbi:hypothetical protein BVRB_8g182940 [Beta vulgaris subsp. vulgaris]|nr:hypothetical protein BVRB_8g182940 [Beta vulgaris subsp. vulgaris]